jgi:hypothetical protein
MKKWGYSFPAGWNVKKISWLSESLFNVLKIIRNMYWKFKQNKSALQNQKSLLIPIMDILKGENMKSASLLQNQKPISAQVQMVRMI